MGKYLKIQVEGQFFMVDMEFTKPEDIKLSYGDMDVSKEIFTANKHITLKELEKVGFSK